MIPMISLMLPEAWTPYLFYGDIRDVSQEDRDAVAQLIVDNEIIGDPFQIAGFGFSHYHDASRYGIPSAMCNIYTFPVVGP